MSDDATIEGMLDKTRSMARIKEAAAKINKAAGQASLIIRRTEDRLDACGACVAVQGDLIPGLEGREVRIAYGEYLAGYWGLRVIDAEGMNSPLRDASRLVRIQAVTVIPRLLELIALEIEGILKMIETVEGAHGQQ